MRILRLPAALVLLLLVVAESAAQEERVSVDVGPEEIAAKARAKEEVAVLAAELGQLRAKASALEASIAVNAQELKSKDVSIETLKKLVGEMSQKIATLQNEIAPLQVHVWLARLGAPSMELMSSKWNEHGEPAVNSLLQKASEKSLQAKEWAKPHMETAKAKWATAKTNTEPYVQMVSSKSVDVYQASRDAISPHVLKAHEFADPYFQETKKLSKSYIDQVAEASKPHVEKFKTTLKPYTDKAGSAYEKFLETANLYHKQKEQESGEEVGVKLFKQVANEVFRAAQGWRVDVPWIMA